MRTAIVGFVAGCMLLQWQSQLPSSILIAGLLLGALLIAAAIFFLRSQKIVFLLRVICGGLFGFVWAAFLALHALQHTLPKAWEGRDVTIVGTIDSLPVHFERGVRFQFAVEQAFEGDDPIAAIPPKVALAWYAAYNDDADRPLPVMRPGERWQLTVRLKRPHGNANPYGFDYEAWLLEQGIRATGYVRQDEKLHRMNERIDAFVFSIGGVIDRARASLRDHIQSALPDAPYAGILVALVIGEQRAIRPDDWEIFTRTGISHLVSISGLHITMIAGMMAMLMSFLWRRSFFTQTQFPLLLPVQKVAALTGASVALIYVLLAGFGVPAQRTLYMLMVVALALWCNRITSVSRILFAALGVVLLLDPWSVLWPGFWLSFGAVAAILYVSIGRASQHQASQATGAQRWKIILKTATTTQYAVTVGLVPLTLLLFGQVSLISPIANAIAIPIVSLIVTPLALVGSVLPAPLAGWVLSAAHFPLESLVAFLAWLSRFQFAVWSAPIPSLAIFIIALVGTAWMLAPHGWPVRWLGALCCLPLFLNVPLRPLPGEAWITVFDVGQGSAVLIETHQHRLLYDTGPAYSPESDGGNRVILPYLKGRGIHSLDAMILTHRDSDHSGGAMSVLKSLAVHEIFSSLSSDQDLIQSSQNHRRCEAGQRWMWDGVRFDMLYPTEYSYAKGESKSNDMSCVMKVSAGKHSILLPADIGKAQETALISRDEKILQSTVLLAPHHGGAGSSTEAFLQAVKPTMALFQVGYRNRYNHPRPDVVARYDALGIKHLRTDESGAIQLRFGETLQIDEYRKTAMRYWWQ